MRAEDVPEAAPLRLSDVTAEPAVRVELRPDWDRVLGGGLALGTITFIAGAPGSGKTTEALGLAAALGTNAEPCIYAASEWDLSQVALRARDVGVDGERIAPFECKGWSVVEVLERAEEIAGSRSRCIVVDSWGGLAETHPSDVERVRDFIGPEGAALIIGHVTKAGELAGAATLAHKADAIVWVRPRSLRVSKNWHGPAPLRVPRERPNFDASRVA